MLAEYTQGNPVRTFTYDGAGRMIEATVFTLTTRFTYNGLGARVAVEVVGHGTATYTLDYAAGGRVLAETTGNAAVHYLYGYDCLGELRDDDWLYYLNDATGYLRQGADEQGEVVSGWLFDPDGTVLEGPEGPVSHLICGGVYDWSTGLIHKDGRYFDPMLGIWLALMPLIVVQSWKGRKKRRGFPWYSLLLLVVCMSGMLTGCIEPGDGPGPTACVEAPTPIPEPPTPTPESEGGCEVIGKTVINEKGWGSHGYSEYEYELGFAYEVHWTVVNPDACMVVQIIQAAWGENGEITQRWGPDSQPHVDNIEQRQYVQYDAPGYEWAVTRTGKQIVLYDRPGPSENIGPEIEGTTFSLWFNAWPRLYSTSLRTPVEGYPENPPPDPDEWTIQYPEPIVGSALPGEPFHIHWEYKCCSEYPSRDEIDVGFGQISMP
jgi:hypothetical protein